MNHFNKWSVYLLVLGAVSLNIDGLDEEKLAKS